MSYRESFDLELRLRRETGSWCELAREKPKAYIVMGGQQEAGILSIDILPSYTALGRRPIRNFAAPVRTGMPVVSTKGSLLLPRNP